MLNHLQPCVSHASSYLASSKRPRLYVLGLCSHCLLCINAFAVGTRSSFKRKRAMLELQLLCGVAKVGTKIMPWFTRIWKYLAIWKADIRWRLWSLSTLFWAAVSQRHSACATWKWHSSCFAVGHACSNAAFSALELSVMKTSGACKMVKCGLLHITGQTEGYKTVLKQEAIPVSVPFLLANRKCLHLLRTTY